MISSGIFILPGLAFAQAGPAVIVAYLLSGALALVGAMSLAELTSALPKAGGDYFFTSRSLGPLLGLIMGFLSWVGLAFKSAFAVFGVAELAYLFLGWPTHWTAIGALLVLLIINLFGLKTSVLIDALLVVLLLAILGIYVGLGLPHINLNRFVDFAPQGWGAVFRTAGLVFVAYGGLLKIATIAEEVRHPKTSLSKAILAALIFTIFLYCCMLVVATGTLSSEKMQQSLTPIADSAAVFLQRSGYLLLSFASLLAFITTANSGLMAAARYPLALSRDKLIPDAFSRFDPKFNTPIVALLSTALVTAAALFLRLELLVKVGSAFLILTYLVINLVVIILRESALPGYRPAFKTPLYPYLQIAGSIFYLLILSNMGWKVLASSVGFIGLAILVYWLYAHPHRNAYEYALLHLLERLTNRRLAGDNLERELKEIISERDEIVFDRFDHLVDKALIVDLEQKYSLPDFFRLAAEAIAPRVGLSPQEIEQALLQREQESSTALAPFIAVPHLIIKGQNIFDLTIFRCREGIYFSPATPAVKAVFVLIGTADERHFHLRALAAIAQIAFNSEFAQHWLQARGSSGLKHLIHLAERQRFF